MIEHKDELNATWSAWTSAGPSARASPGYVERMAHNITFFADLAEKYYDEAFRDCPATPSTPNRQPVGVAGLITPWNMPQMLADLEDRPGPGGGQHRHPEAGRADPGGLPCGWRQLAREAGFPARRLQCGHGFGPDAAGASLTMHPDVKLISFTGETTDRRGHHGGRRADPEAGLLRAGRQGHQHHLRRRRPGEGRWTSPCGVPSTTRARCCLAGSRIFVEQPLSTSSWRPCWRG